METGDKKKKQKDKQKDSNWDVSSTAGLPPDLNVDDNEVDINNLFQRLDTPLKFEEILVPPNATGLDDVVSIINGGKPPPASSSVFGRLIKPGMLGIISSGGNMRLVGPGRYICPGPRTSIVAVVSFTENLIVSDTITIARVQRGEIGLAMHNGQPLLLAEGIHAKNDRLFKFESFQTINQEYIKHGSIHMIRVPKGFYGLITENAIPKLLPEGLHITNSNVFTFDGIQTINQPCLSHGTMHILRVPKGQVALISDNNKPKLLDGTHYINSNTFTYHGLQDLNQQVIRHGTITRFRVRKGEIGLGWDNNQPVFFEEGIYFKDSILFSFEGCVSANEKKITLGSKKLITVWDGEVGISYQKGKLVVMHPDRHLIDSMDYIFDGFLSTQQQCAHLVDSKDKKDGKEKKILTCETKDFVEIGIKADVFYKIEDPEKVLLVVGKDNIAQLVKETAIATLNSIIRSTALREIAQNKEVTAQSQKKLENQAAGFAPSAPMFFDKVHDEFISKLHDTFLEHYGISVTNIRIESFHILNQELASSISKQAMTTAQTETQLANLASQTEIATAQQQRDADVARIKAEGEAVKLKTETDAKNRSVLEIAKAEADANVIRAKSEASAVELRAQAEAKSILLRGEAEAKRAELLANSPLGPQIQMYQMYADMVKNALGGVEKVIYMPVEMANNPLNFWAMQQGSIPGLIPSSTGTKK